MSMHTSKRVVHIGAAQALGLNHLTNALGLKTDLVMGVVATGIEVMMTVEDTDEVVVVAPTSDLEEGPIMEEAAAEVDIAVDVEEDIMIEGIIVEEEVIVLKCGRKEKNKAVFDLRTP